MGAFDKVSRIAIPDDSDPEEAAAFRKKWRWEPHEIVFIKDVYTGIEEETVGNASSGIKGKGKSREIDYRIGTARNKLLEVMILDWTFTENGRKVEVSPGRIIRLPARYRKPILEICDEIAETMDEEEQEDFLPSANGHLQESSDEMSPSLKSS